MALPGAHEELLPILHRALQTAVAGTGDDPGLVNGGGLGIRHIAAATIWIGLGFPASAGWVKSGDGPWPSGATVSSTINNKEMGPQPTSGVGLEEHGQGALSGKPH